jgi:hypothetical protein
MMIGSTEMLENVILVCETGTVVGITTGSSSVLIPKDCCLAYDKVVGTIAGDTVMFDGFVLDALPSSVAAPELDAFTLMDISEHEPIVNRINKILVIVVIVLFCTVLKSVIMKEK